MGIDRSDCENILNLHLSLKSTQYYCSTLQRLSESVLTREAIIELFPNMNKLFVHALVLPVSTVDCERCFKRVKTTLRNRMSTTTLDSLLRIRIEGPESADFNFAEAAKKWASIRNRRLFNLCVFV